MKRPLCLFVLSFACISFLLQIISRWAIPQSGIPQQMSEGESVCISGQLQKKEEKNGNIIYYLKYVQILDPAQEPVNQKNQVENQVNQSKEQFQKKIKSAELGAVCYPDVTIQNPVGRNNGVDHIGQWLLIKGTLSFYDGAENEGQFDSREYYEGMGYHFKIYGAKVEERGESYDKLGEWLFQKRQIFSAFFKNHMKADNAGILTAMLLGDKTAMDGNIKSLYQKSGIAHVLAISGLHISLLGMFLYRLLRRLLLPLPICCLTGIGVILLYGKMTGPGTSSFRAICMFILFLLADLLNRTYDLPSAMAFAALLSFLKEPEIIQEAGFLLSYLAVIGLVVVSPVLKNSFNSCISKSKKLKPTIYKIAENSAITMITNSLLASLSTQIMIFPVLLWFYYEFSFYSILLNLMVIPCMSIVLLSGLAGCITGISFCLIPADIILDFYEWICTLSRSLPHSLVITGRPGVWQVVLYYALILTWLHLARKSEKEALADSTAASAFSGCFNVVYLLFPIFCTLLFFLPVHQEDRVDFLSIGQGDSICMRDTKGNVVLVDGGSTDVKEAGKYRLIPFLKYHGISYVDVAFVSHAHEDHYSAIVELLETGKEEGISVGAVCISAYGRGREEYEVIVTAAVQAGAEVIYIQKGDAVSCGKMHFSCLYPAADITVTDENDASLVLYGEYQGTRKNLDGGSNIGSLSVLFTGDSTINCDEEVIEELRQRSIDQISLLKVAHHGSRESTGEELLRQISPSVAVISCGRDNSYGHPHSETLERLEDAGSVILTTPEYGAVTVEVGEKLKVYGFAR